MKTVHSAVLDIVGIIGMNRAYVIHRLTKNCIFRLILSRLGFSRQIARLFLYLSPEAPDINGGVVC